MAAYIESFVNGIDYGISESTAFMTGDSDLRPEHSELHQPKAFIVGRRTGDVAGGIISFLVFDVGSLGSIPCYYHHKHKTKKLLKDFPP